MNSAAGVARTLRDVLLDAHEAATGTVIAVQACEVAFAENPEAERLRLLLLARVQGDVSLCMALAHLADAIVDALDAAK